MLVCMKKELLNCVKGQIITQCHNRILNYRAASIHMKADTRIHYPIIKNIVSIYNILYNYLFTTFHNNISYILFFFFLFFLQTLNSSARQFSWLVETSFFPLLARFYIRISIWYLMEISISLYPYIEDIKSILGFHYVW